TPAQSVATPSASAGSPSPIAVSGGAVWNAEYEKVAARLDAGGVAYFYWNGKKIFGELGNVFGPVAEAALSEPGLTSGDKELVRKYLDLAGRCTGASGIGKIKAFGFSSKESEPGVFLNKSYLYVPDREGILWETFAKSPHDFTELNMVPAKAEA